MTFEFGERLVHDSFGLGVVVGVEAEGQIIVVFFEDGEQRKLMAEFAPLTRMSAIAAAAERVKAYQRESGLSWSEMVRRTRDARTPPGGTP